VSTYLRGRATPAECGAVRKRLMAAMQAKYTGHWHEEEPSRGSAFRALVIGSECGVLDGLIAASLEPDRRLATAFRAAMSAQPGTLTLWVDPGCVSYRCVATAVRCSNCAGCVR